MEGCSLSRKASIIIESCCDAIAGRASSGAPKSRGKSRERTHGGSMAMPVVGSGNEARGNLGGFAELIGWPVARSEPRGEPILLRQCVAFARDQARVQA